MNNIVLIGRKVDMDSCGAGLFLGVTRGDKVDITNKATEQQLADPQIICIECGGAGRTMENNWDHHEAGGPTESATMQAAKHTLKDTLALVSYIDIIDTQGPQVLREAGFETPKVAMTDVFAGMLLVTRDIVEQFHRGVEVLRKVMDEDIDPFGEMPELPEWQPYIAAKRENDRQLVEAVQTAQWDTTKGGKKLGYLETRFAGAPGALYDSGGEIVVAFNPTFGNPPVRKFTIAGNGIRVDAILPKLNALEPGWGGPATGTIIGSPREGSKLSMEIVVNMVKETL